MGWDNKRRYYTRSRKVNGRVVREYIGSGACGQLAAEFDAIQREKRALEHAEQRAQQAELDTLDAPIRELDKLAELLARATLLACGYRQHKRGEWRKRRERDDNAS